jgi:hypothetical protein
MRFAGSQAWIAGRQAWIAASRMWIAASRMWTAASIAGSQLDRRQPNGQMRPTAIARMFGAGTAAPVGVHARSPGRRPVKD